MLTHQQDAQLSAPAISPDPRRTLARAVTELFAPAAVVAVLLGAVAWHTARTTADALLWGTIAVAFAAVVPFVYIVYGVRKRRLTDHHVRVREQRRLPLLVGMVSVLIGFALIALGGAQRELVALVGAMVVGLATSGLVTLFWKISIHVAVAAGALVILVLVFGSTLLVLAPLVILIGWARVAVDDHTPAQVVAGAALGGAVAGAIFPLLR